ncbi:UbiA prenyltransferase [Xylaria sp. FL1777]|nr:UbiA prenyltransferase [Xylaria sp. FL1777]
MGPRRQASSPEATSLPLATRYGGLHAGAWVNGPPANWIPFVQFARLSPPAGVFLVFFSILAGSFFLSNAIDGWNDIIDAPIDSLVARTRDRPIVRGAISLRAAFIFTVSQALAGLSLLFLLPSSATWTVVSRIASHFYYPWSKRHTYCAQLELGFYLAWGVPVGTAAADIEPWSEAAIASTACLLLAFVAWTGIYDTVYAFQDVNDDDKRIGLKSMAILFQQRAKIFLLLVLSCLLSLLIVFGRLVGGSLRYYLVAVCGSSLSLGWMILNVDLKDPQSCWWWFRYRFWLAGGSIVAGLLRQCVFV